MTALLTRLGKRRYFRIAITEPFMGESNWISYSKQSFMNRESFSNFILYKRKKNHTLNLQQLLNLKKCFVLFNFKTKILYVFIFLIFF